MTERLLRLVLNTLRRHGLRPPPRRESPSVRKALARLDGDPASPIGLSELAKLVEVSRFQLLRGFAREVGTTPHAYLVQRRIHFARRLLVAGLPIVEAAMEAGFADQSHLTRAFVSQFGITPAGTLLQSPEIQPLCNSVQDRRREAARFFTVNDIVMINIRACRDDERATILQIIKCRRRGLSWRNTRRLLARAVHVIRRVRARDRRQCRVLGL